MDRLTSIYLFFNFDQTELGNVVVGVYELMGISLLPPVRILKKSDCPAI
jgi:hypothetical protein